MTEPKTKDAPHDCPQCGEPCYLPFTGPPKCTSRACMHFDQEIWCEHIMETPEDESGEEFEIDEDAETDPYLTYPNIQSPSPLGIDIDSLRKQVQKYLDDKDDDKLRGVSHDQVWFDDPLTSVDKCAKLSECEIQERIDASPQVGPLRDFMSPVAEASDTKWQSPWVSLAPTPSED